MYVSSSLSRFEPLLSDFCFPVMACMACTSYFLGICSLILFCTAVHLTLMQKHSCFVSTIAGVAAETFFFTLSLKPLFLHNVFGVCTQPARPTSYFRDFKLHCFKRTISGVHCIGGMS
mmetsp:Transcript_99366/g.171048  ORF Transcript_99366/g.171048 Transcript_99366/m.171048 type:complete len:118 (-) Transcript_99366:19-372(-)